MFILDMLERNSFSVYQSSQRFRRDKSLDNYSSHGLYCGPIKQIIEYIFTKHKHTADTRLFAASTLDATHVMFTDRLKALTLHFPAYGEFYNKIQRYQQQ